MKKFFVWFLFCSILLAGCGYTNKVTLPKNIKSVYVPNFRNAINIKDLFSYRGGLETDITNAVINRFLYDGNLKVVSKEQESDAILEGEITQFHQEPLRYNNLEQIQEFRLFIVCKIKLVERKTGEVLIQEDYFSGRSQYYLTGANATSQSEASRNAIADLAKDIVDRVVEEW